MDHACLRRVLEPKAFLWTLGSLSQIHRLPFDAKLILQHFVPPYTVASLQQAAEALGFEAEFKRIKRKRLTKSDLPCVAFEIGRAPLDDAAASSDPAQASADGQVDAETPSELRSTDARAAKTGDPNETCLPALVVNMDDRQVMYFPAGSDKPQTIAIDTFLARFEPMLLFVTAAQEVAPDDDTDNRPREFGFRWFVPELLRHKGIWRDVLLASLAIQLLGLTTPLFTQVVIDKVIVHQTMNTLVVIGTGLFMFMLFNAVMSWTRQYLVLHTGQRIDAVLGSRVFKQLLELPLRYYERRPTGTLVARIHGVETIREFITGAAVSLFLDLPFLFVFLAVMFYYSWQLTLIVVAILSIISVLSLSITPLLRKRLNEQFQVGARNQAFLTEYVSGMETVKSLQMEPQLKHRFGDYLSQYLAAAFNTRRLSNTYNVTANTLEQIQTLAILCVGAWMVMTTDQMTIGMLVAFQMFASRLSQPVLRLVSLWQEFQQASIAVKRLGDIMNAPVEPYAIKPSRATDAHGHINIEGLSFRYSDQHPYLYRDLSLTIAEGTTVAVMGPSGSGKSTLAKLLQGFYQPDDGHILVDNRDIRHLSANELRNYFGVVPQETTLFSGTLYDNLIIANPHASFEQVIQACRMAEIHELIEKLPQGYQTELGEHGVGLSGGQKQRVAIARALLKRPKILIFDEATSHLDHATAEHFARTVNALKGKVTILFITHQVPKGLRVDDAVMLGTGSVTRSDEVFGEFKQTVERGRQSDLLQEGARV